MATLSAQSSAVVITDLKPKHDNKFPEIHYAPNPKVAEKINTFLQLDYLEHLPGMFKKHPFELVSYDRPNRDMGGVKGFNEWKKEQTPQNILSLTMDVDFTGAYSEEYQKHHNYDIRTGNIVSLESLIKNEQKKIFAQLLTNKAKKTINDFLTELNKGIAEDDSIADRETYDRDQEQLYMYSHCIDEQYPNTLMDYEFYFSKDSLHIIRGGCSAHVNRALDDIGDFHFRFSYADMQKYFSAYGKSLVTNNASVVKIDSPKGKIYKGKIGAYPITILLQEIEEDGSLSITYWYDKKKLPIEWRGDYSEHHFSLKEEIETPKSFETSAVIEANYSNGTISGTWTNVKTHKVLKLIATEY
jgi:hypothetical protein